MIHRFVKEFQRFDRDIEVLTYTLVAFLLILAARAVFFVYEGQFDQLWSLLAPTTPLIATLLVVRVANRLIVNGNIIRENDRRQEVVRITHHLIAITKDLKGRVGFAKKVLGEGDCDSLALALSKIAITIEDRYETLLDRDAYKFLPGKCIDIITKISGSIFGIGLLATGMQHAMAANQMIGIKGVPNENSHLIAQLDDLMTDIQELIDELYRLRNSIDAESKRP